MNTTKEYPTEFGFKESHGAEIRAFLIPLFFSKQRNRSRPVCFNLFILKNMKTLSVRQQIKNAPKYVLELHNLGLYISASQGLTGCNLTEDTSKAMQYAVGFDNPETKKGIWTATLKRMMNNDNVILNTILL